MLWRRLSLSLSVASNSCQVGVLHVSSSCSVQYQYQPLSAYRPYHFPTHLVQLLPWPLQYQQQHPQSTYPPRRRDHTRTQFLIASDSSRSLPIQPSLAIAVTDCALRFAGGSCPSRLPMSSHEAPMRLTRSRSRSQTRTAAIQLPLPSSSSSSDRKRRPIDQPPHNGYTAEEEDQASKFLKIDEEDDNNGDDVDMQSGSEPIETSTRKRSRSRSSAGTTTSKKQKEQPTSAAQPPPVHTTTTTTTVIATAAAPAQPSPAPSVTSTSASVSRPSLQPPSSGALGTGQRSRSHSNARSSNSTAYIAPELLSGGGAAFTPALSTSSTASLQPPVIAAAKRRPSVPNLPSQSRSSSSSSSLSSHSSSSTAADAQTTEFRLQLTLERLSQLRRQLDSVEGAAQLLDLSKQVDGIAYKAGQPHTVSVSRLSAVHNELLSAMRQLAEQTAGTESSASVAAGRLLTDRIVPRSVASIVSSRALLSQSLPALITSDLPQSHKLLLLNPAAVHQRDSDGFTALHYAVLNHDLPLIAYLCQYGASPAVLNNSRASPLALARLNSIDTSGMISHPAAQCSRVEGGQTNVRQEFWHCETCGLTGERGCCDVCSVRCHKGHVMQQVTAAESMCNEGWCDCCDVAECHASGSTQSEQQQAADTLDAAAAVLSSEEDSIFSTVNGAISASNARSMLRLMEDVIVSTAELMKAAGAGEAETEAEAAAGDDEHITWSDVGQASALTAVLTLSFYALFGGAPDIVNTAAPAVHWMQERWQQLTASITDTKLL